MLVLPLFLVLYFERNFRSIYPHRFNRLLCAVICNAVIQVFADLSGVCNLAVMANVSAVVMAVVCVAVLVSLIKLEKKNWRLQNIMPIASVFVLLAGEVAKVILKSISMYEYVEAAVLYTMTLSGLLLAFTPQWTPPALKPWAAHTPPAISFIMVRSPFCRARRLGAPY